MELKEHFRSCSTQAPQYSNTPVLQYSIPPAFSLAPQGKTLVSSAELVASIRVPLTAVSTSKRSSNARSTMSAATSSPCFSFKQGGSSCVLLLQSTMPICSFSPEGLTQAN